MITATATLLLGVLAVGNVEVYEFTAPWCGGCQKMQPTVEKLAQTGVSVRQIQFDNHRELAQQFGVDRLPTFLVVSDGEVIDRVVGAASLSQLTGMVGRAEKQMKSKHAASQIVATSPGTTRRNQPAARTVIRGQQETKRKGIGNAIASLMDRVHEKGRKGHSAAAAAPPTAPLSPPPIHPVVPAANFSETKAPRTGPTPKTANGVANASFESPLTVPKRNDVVADDGIDESAVKRAMAATVRLRVVDPEGASLGTGTIIDIHQDEALILTCGHIFDDSDGKGEITCDLGGGNGEQKLPGKLISYDMRRDIGLVSVRPGKPVEAVEIAGLGYRPSEHNRVFSVGCGHGEPATVIRNEILAVNRYHGPANLVVGGRPVNGRSGGGLFDAKGRLIGVCNAADQEEDEGLYAALGPIHAELDSVGLGFIYRPSQPSLASVPGKVKSPSGSRATNSSPKKRTPSALIPNSPQSNATPAIPGATTFADSGSEVICIVRPKGAASNAGQAFVLERPSPELLNKLSQELARRGPHATTGYSDTMKQQTK